MSSPGVTQNRMSQLRALDMEIVQHVIARGKLWVKREKIAQLLAGSQELADYQAELNEWLGAMTNESKGGSE